MPSDRSPGSTDEWIDPAGDNSYRGGEVGLSERQTTASELVEDMERRLGMEPFDPCPSADEWRRLIEIVSAADAVWCDDACGINDGEALERLRVALGRQVCPV